MDPLAYWPQYVTVKRQQDLAQATGQGPREMLTGHLP